MSDTDDLWTQLAAIQFDDKAPEAAVEDRLLRPLIRALGWKDECVHAKASAKRWFGSKVQRGRKPEADFVLGEPTPGHVAPDMGYVVLEAKRPDEDLDDARSQAESYSISFRAPLFVVCDGRELQVWRTGWTEGTLHVMTSTIDQLCSARAALERCLSPRAARAYRDQQKLTAIRADYDLADYLQHVHARTLALSAIPRAAQLTRPNGSTIDVEIGDVSLPEIMGPGTCTFLDSGTGRGKTTVLHLLARAAVRPKVPSFLPLVLSTEDVTSSLLETALEELRPHVKGLESVAGVAALFADVPPIVLLDDWHRTTSAHRRCLDQMRQIVAARGAVVIASTTKIGRPTIATHLLSLNRFSTTERDAVVRRRTNLATGGELEASLPPEIQPLAREPLFIHLLIDALCSNPKGEVTIPPNLTSLMQRLLELVTDREHSPPTVDSITWVNIRLANATTFGAAEIRRALDDCGGESTTQAFAAMMERIGLWHAVSMGGNYAFSNPAWRAYFQACGARADNGSWARWVRNAAFEHLEIAIPYAAHLAAVSSQEDELFHELLRRDARLYMRSLVHRRRDAVKRPLVALDDGLCGLRPDERCWACVPGAHVCDNMFA